MATINAWQPAVWFSRAPLRYTLDILSAQCLAALNCTCRCAHQATGDMVRVCVRTQHGIVESAVGIHILRMLEQMPESRSIDLRRRSGRRVLSGNHMEPICVGGLETIRTKAQFPPSQGDAWELDVPLQRGCYTLCLAGYVNPSHGILELSVDGSPLDVIDWCAVRTGKQTARKSLFVPFSGTHRLLARVGRTSADALRQNGYWMCLRRISFRRREGSVGTRSESSDDWTIQRRFL